MFTWPSLSMVRRISLPALSRAGFAQRRFVSRPSGSRRPEWVDDPSDRRQSEALLTESAALRLKPTSSPAIPCRPSSKAGQRESLSALLWWADSRELPAPKLAPVLDRDRKPPAGQPIGSPHTRSPHSQSKKRASRAGPRLRTKVPPPGREPYPQRATSSKSE